ncbi:GNAT family N-acetyltransferase [Elizabethkingia miricola]|uniref:GNAT family N-acetyltransferase n=2 Tax=Elizabethkingia miricola TaxID=172045 RepID=UPI000B34D434|nr:GNAT family N-acetyltransferase [Elizabethkingia miricola]NHQ67228.1 GNAT family N-acetyltransferase [Elizabethkingia miricola]NHQ71375.1 GNAT family N-acetyltransferase [Elizabethkingia miricola]NHQ78158.1 GNAT family N-acetyltransferase [Elizabethkingia miricola]PSL88654.1 N-acetyltransferase [Elizabethkingia miricola]QHQ88008.1 GNAT family N-acetyltransferase [Elizabethkingia miricola]
MSRIDMNSAIFPILKTERLTLRQLSIDDHQDIFALRSDPEINEFLGRQICETKEEAIIFINKVNDNIKEGNSFYWAVTLAESNTLVGTICLFDLSAEDDSCEIGYELMTEFQGQGIMTEAVQTVIDYVFHTLKLKKILAVTHYKNQSSTNLLLKFDFVKSIETYKEDPELNIFTLSKDSK